MASFWKVFLLPTLVAAAAIVFILLREDDFDPQAYALPPPPKLDGPLTPNNRLRNAQLLLKGQISGPESILVEGDTLYTGTWDGKVLQIVNGVIRKTIRFTDEKVCGTFDTEPKCGRPLGIRRLNKDLLVVVDTYLGVFTVDFEKGTYKKVFAAETQVDGARSGFLNDVDVLDEKTVFVTDSSTARDRRRFLHAFLEQKPNGRVIKLDATTGKAEVVLKGLYFTNGIQLLPDKQSFIVAECSMARIKRHYIAGPKAGKTEIFADNLPGFPDNIRQSTSGTYYVGLASIRHSDATSLMDSLGPVPWLRKIFVQAIPEKYLATLFTLVKPKYGILVELDANGRIVSSMQDPNGVVIADVSQVSDGGSHLYLGSFHSDFIAKLPKKNL
ncbi:Protein F57C2.5 [Aphelenchoides avenae]|nr:Protein F57C2.5 [Aphelenchus avenae]